MKFNKMVKYIFLLCLISILLSSCGPSFGKVINGYYINKRDGTKFKLPPNTRVDADWAKKRGSGEGMEIDIMWLKKSPIYSSFLTDIWYENIASYRNFIIERNILKEIKESKAESNIDIINCAISEVIWSWERMKNFAILERSVDENTEYGPQGKLIISFNYSSEKKELMIYRFMIKKDFIVWIDYRNFEDKFDKAVLSRMIDELIESFEVI